MTTDPVEPTALQAHFPQAQLPRVALGRWPGPIRQLTKTLHCLDEGECSAVYGGNKVRKLEHIFGSHPDTLSLIHI